MEVILIEKENLSIDPKIISISTIRALLHQISAFSFHLSTIATRKEMILFYGDLGAEKLITLQVFYKKL